jgi:formylglycine-generating enzyme required for sulfatase activity
VVGSGWNPADDVNLPMDKIALTTALACDALEKTWTDAPAGSENKPINCVDFYLAFAFCVWDGGRLATEAEWNFAAAGGSEQRTYAWVGSTFDSAHAYNSDSGGPTFVGATSPQGDGKFGHVDLNGNVNEWILDKQNPLYLLPCTDCADLDGGPNRGRRGGGWRPFGGNPPEQQLNTYMRFGFIAPTERRVDVGISCARAK